jgi:membrane-associated HD superfamily phosphohydrolase
MNSILINYSCSEYLNFATFSKISFWLPLFYGVILHYIALHSVYLVFPTFIARLTCVVTSNGTYVLSFMVFMCLPNKLTSIWIPWTFMRAYSKADMKSNSNKASFVTVVNGK